MQSEAIPKTIPCAMLVFLQSDLAAIAKLKTLPFKRDYRLREDSFIELSMDKMDDGLFHLEVHSSDRVDRATDPKLKKIVDLAHMFAWRALSTTLSRVSLPPCASMAHSGADEILALYQCLAVVALDANQPFSRTIDGPNGPYQLFALELKGNLREIIIETNYVYGTSMKWRAELEYPHQVVERANKIISDVLGAWLRPNGTSLRMDLDREMNVCRPT